MKIRWSFIILELMSMHVEVFLMSLILILSRYLPAWMTNPVNFYLLKVTIETIENDVKYIHQ